MSRREELNEYIVRVQRRLRLNATARGAAIVAAVALVATVGITLVLNRYAFPESGIGPARLVLLALVVGALAFGLAWPFFRLNRRRSIERAEKRFPVLEERLVTFSERQQANDPFIELLAADTLDVAKDAPPARVAPSGRVLALMAAGAACAGVLVWMVVAAPGYMGYGASLLWTGPKHNVAPLYEIKVTPGDQAVRRNSDQLVTAQVIGLETSDVKLFARYQSASKWEPVTMSATEGGAGFQFLFAGLPESVDYYVAAGPVKSKQYKFRVVDLPAVKQIQVTYKYPRWTGLEEVSEEHGGDLRALEGTDAELTVVMDAPLKDGVLVGDDGKPLQMKGGEGNRYRATIHMSKDGSYHVAAIDGGQQVRLSEDYFISTEKANPPSIAIDRPGADYRASPIEEVTIGVKAGADFGLTHVSMHYSVNGGPEKVVDLSKAPGAKTVNGTTTLPLEDYKLVPGDVVSLYATAKDAHAEAKTDISFIQVDPFEREFSQSQSGGGGGGGGGGGQGDQTDISRREKELIAATWKQQNEKNPTEKQAADMGKVLSEAQLKLRDQVKALQARMESRDLSAANEEFNSFGKDMQDAAAAMVPSADKLKSQAWADAMPNEQKALQALLRAEATFRKIVVAFGQRGGGGGGGGGSAGRDLASLFDLELDTEKNQYETAQTGSPAEEQAKKVDDALAKLDALAKRQEEMAQQQNGKEPTFQQRWQQEMLRREAEQLQREMEQMQQGQKSGQQSASNAGQQGQSGQQGQQGKSGQSGPASGSSGSSGGQSGQQQASTKDGGADPRVQQALDRLRAANEAMKRAGTQGQGGQQGAQQSAEAAQRAAQRLREAQSLLGGAQQQQANGKLDQLARQAGQLTKEESDQAARIRALASQSQQSPDGGRTPAQISEMMKERNRLADERQKLSDELGHLEKGMRDAARETASTQPGVSSKLRDALSGMDESDLTTRTQKTADWLRSGINPESNGTEGEIAQGLKSLSDQVREAQQSMGAGTDPGKGGRRAGDGTETAALGHVDKLRSELQQLGLNRGQSGQSGRAGQQGQPGNGQQRGQGRAGQQQGQGQQGQGEQQGQGQQSGQGQQGGQRGGSGQQQAQNGQGGGRGNPQGGQQGGDQRGGDIGGDTRRGGGTGTTQWNVDTGGQRYAAGGRPNDHPDVGALHGDPQQKIDQGLQELNQLRTLAKNDPAALKEIDDLAKSMQRLDPSRFPGNPEMVERLHTQVLNDVDKLELQLRRNADDTQPGQVRTNKPQTVPPGYEDAVAAYYRRLGKGQ
jgi:hypothetical protein